MKRAIFCVLGMFLLTSAILEAKDFKGYLGVHSREISKTEQASLGATQGVFITDAIEGSPAEAAGLKSGDIVLAINGDTIEDRDEFTGLIAENPGELVELTVLREGKKLKLQAKLDKKEEDGGVNGVNVNFMPPGEGGLGIAHMALLIPILAVFMTFLVPILWFYFDYRKRALKTKERLLAIEKGVALPPDPVAPPRKPITPFDILRRGFISLGIGAALIIYSFLSHGKQSSFVMGGGLIIFFIGLALVIWYRVVTKKGNNQNSNSSE